MNELKYKHFWLRRLHSLTGLMMGLFLFNHFLINSFIFEGAEAFNHKVGLLDAIPYLLFVEIALIFVPFAFHAIYGFFIIYKGEWNTSDYPHNENWMYTVQRVTAWLIAAFTLYHVIEWRFYYKTVFPHHAGGEFVLGLTFYEEMLRQFSQPWYALVYLIGVGAAIIHFANGLVTICIRWGVATGTEAHKRIAVCAWGVALVYALLIGKAFAVLLQQVGVELESAALVAASIQPAGIFF